MRNIKRLNSILAIPILSVVLFTGALSIPGFTSQSNEVIDDSIQDFTFGLIQLSSATHITETYASITSSNVSYLVPGLDLLQFDITASGTIPSEPDAYINATLGFGYAWLDSIEFPSNAVSATIHPQLNDGNLVPEIWHVHSIVVNSDGCISEMNELPGGVMTNGQTISATTTESISPVNMINFQSAISFEIVTDSTTCPAPLSGLKMVT